MSYKPKTLFRILEQIQQKDLLLPHIQRPFVWEEEQMIRLFDSLMRNYPIQTLLFWRTNEEIRARDFMDTIDREKDLSELYNKGKSAKGVAKTFVLDGQQRIQTLYAIFCGDVKQAAGQSAQAYLDVTEGTTEIDGGDLMYRVKFSDVVLALPHYRIRNLWELDRHRDAATIADDINDKLELLLHEDSDKRRVREKHVRKNISQLRSLLLEELFFWIEELDGIASSFPYRKILDIFVRVNSGGTKLTASDLMFASMKEGWEDIEENIEQTVDMLNSPQRLEFDTFFPLKAMMVAAGEGAETGTEKFNGAKGEQLLEKLKNHWDQSEECFKQLGDFIEKDLRLFSSRSVISYNAFIPLFDYLFHNKKPDPANRALMRGYFYKAQFFGWFSGATDSVLNALHHIVVNTSPGGFPLANIKEHFKARYASVELEPVHLHDKRLRNHILEIAYIENWGISPFKAVAKGNEPHIDHIYPQYMLRSRLGETSAAINDIGNLRYVGATDNIRKRGELPSSYFTGLQASANIEKHLLVREFSESPDKLLFDSETFARFKQLRRDRIYQIAKKVIDPEC